MVMSRLESFVRTGRKIVAIGRNYREHAAELGNPVPKEPVIFLKPSTAFITEGQAIQLPPGSSEIHHEVELGIVIGKEASTIGESTAMDHVGGYCLALDMTNRIAQNAAKDNGLPWTLAKGFDTSCPVSDFIPKDKIGDPHNVDIWLKVNGELKQQGNTGDLVFSIPFLISFISKIITLEAGDLILTGTPSGVGPVKAGDVILAGLGKQVNMSFPVIAKQVNKT